jgi:hypothetical protein
MNHQSRPTEPQDSAELAAERDRLEIEAVMRRFEAIKAAWPYDVSQEMTDAQLQEQGAVNVTEQLTGSAFVQFFGKR